MNDPDGAADGHDDSGRAPETDAERVAAEDAAETAVAAVEGAAGMALPRVAPSAVRAATAGRPLEETEPADAPVPAASAQDDASEPAAEPPEEELDEHARAWRAVPLQTRIEALLFAATEPLSVRRLVNLSGDAETDDVRGVLEALEAHYRHTARAFSLQEIGGGFQLRTTPELAGLVARVGRKPRAETLSKAALETLAIVAYRQPVLRADIEKIRGVATGEVLRALTEKGLVRVAGRADLPGAPLLYGTTPDFLEVFGLRNLKDLPSDRDLLPRSA